jgi:hypothetical protein
MKVLLLVVCFVGCRLPGPAQSNLPWERPLKIARSTDGTNFTNAAIYQDSSGVPSLIQWKGDTLVCVFQWFRKPQNSITWDKVAVKFSYNGGTTWSSPVPIVVNGLPPGYQRPFDPTLAVVNSTSLRIYYSSSIAAPVGGLDASINTYSAISSDGINYTFEAGPRFDHPTNRVIDPAVIKFNGTWHYLAPIGAPSEGAYHATGTDGITFTQQGNLTSDQNHNWTGNFMLNGQTELRFYGSGPNIWYSASVDGSAWQNYVSTNIRGGDPSTLRINPVSYIIIYVGEPYITGLDKAEDGGLIVYPNPATRHIHADLDDAGRYQYQIYSRDGSLTQSGTTRKGDAVSIEALTPGLYLLIVYINSKPAVAKFVKAN